MPRDEPSVFGFTINGKSGKFVSEIEMRSSRLLLIKMPIGMLIFNSFTAIFYQCLYFIIATANFGEPD